MSKITCKDLLLADEIKGISDYEKSGKVIVLWLMSTVLIKLKFKCMKNKISMDDQ